MAHDTASDTLGHDKAHDGSTGPGWVSRRVGHMHDDRAAADPTPATNSGREVRRAPHPVGGGQHERCGSTGMSATPTARCGPYGGAQRGWPGRRAYASGAGSRVSWHDGGCSAGKCACSRSGSNTQGSGSIRIPPRMVARGATGSPGGSASTVRIGPTAGQTGSVVQNRSGAGRATVRRLSIGCPEFVQSANRRI
jgi:hypothetical protein